jgi:carnitine 3-dehydrogenase
MRAIKTIGIAGAGVIGSGWAARFLFRGLDVVAFDPAPGAENRMRAVIETAWPSMQKLTDGPEAKPGRLSFAPSASEMAAQADFVQEAAPEREDLKTSIFKEIDAAAGPDVIIASSSSGFLPTNLQSQCVHPERVIIGHPFNPVYLLPLVETVPGEKTAPKALDGAGAFYESMGMHVLRLHKEIEGYVCDRLQEALWREALHILDKGIATTGEIDNSIIYSAGLRWALMGSFMTYHLAGGEGGMRHFISQFDPSMELPWTDLAYPKWSDGLEHKLIEGTDAQAGGISVREWETKRNDVLVDLMRVLRQHDIGAGTTLARDEKLAFNAQKYTKWSPESKIPAPLDLYACAVRPQWVDYNGHMSESFYLWAFGEASDALFRYIGINEAYRAAGQSYYTVESHINFLREVSSGEPLHFSTQVLSTDEKRLHIFHTMYHGQTREKLATTEQMLLHVDTKGGRAVPVSGRVRKALSEIVKTHADLPRPEQVGRVMGA